MLSTLFVAIRVQASSSFSRSLSLSLSIRFADVAIVGYSAHGGAGEESRSCRGIDERTNGRTELHAACNSTRRCLLCELKSHSREVTRGSPALARAATSTA